MDEDQIIELIDKYVNNTCTPSEIIKLFEWINLNNENRAYYDSIITIYDLKKKQHVQESVDRVWENIQMKQSSNFRKKQNLGFAKYFVAAAIFIGFLSTTYFLVYQNDDHISSDRSSSIQSTSVLTVPEGSIANLTLCEGTTISIRENSEITYPTSFTDTLVIELDGEAQFYVSKNVERVFRVKTSSQTIDVLGTTFYVKDHKNLSSSRIILAEGKVCLNLINDDSRILKANSSVSYDKETSEIKVKELSSTISSAIINKEYVVKNRPLRLIVEDLEGLYGVEITIANNKKASTLFSGCLHLDKNISEILNTINYKGQFKINKLSNNMYEII